MERHITCNRHNSKCGIKFPELKPCRRNLIGRTVEYNDKNQPHGVHSNMNALGTQNAGKGYGMPQSAPVTSQVKTIQIPRSMKNATFLKHPDLTMGQKRYLCSIAKIYSTSNMRALTDNHLHSQKRCGKVKHEIKEHFRRSQLDHLYKSRSKTCNIESEKKQSVEDSSYTLRVHNTTTENAMTIDAMSEQIKSLSIKDPMTGESTAYTTE